MNYLNKLLLSLCFLGTVPMQAGEVEIEAILEQVPAKNASMAGKQNKALLAEGPDAIDYLLKDYRPFSGKERNIKIEYAINDLSHFLASGLVADTTREQYVIKYLGVLKGKLPMPVKAFIIRQLRFIASEKNITELSVHLKNPALSDATLRALLTIGINSKQNTLIKKALRGAYEGSKGKSQVELLKALGSMRDKGALKIFEEAAMSKNKTLALLGLRALANTADESSYSIFEELIADSKGAVKSNYIGLQLIYAERLGESDNKQLAAKICRSIYQSHHDLDNENIQSAALYSLKTVIKNVNNDLLNALKNKSSHVRSAASKLIAVEDAFDKISKQYNSSNDLTKISILNIIRDHKHQPGKEICLKAIESNNLAVKLGAIEALAVIGDADGAVALLHSLKSSESAAQSSLALMQIKADISAELATAFIKNDDSQYRISLLEILERRKEQSAGFPLAMTAVLSDNKKLRTAAGKTLKTLAAEKDIPALIELIGKLQKRSDLKNIQLAIAAVAVDKVKAVEKITAALKRSKGKTAIALLQLYARIGGKRALAQIEKCTANNEWRIEAYRSLAKWQSADDSLKLLDIASKATEEKYKTLISRQVLKLLKENEVSNLFEVGRLGRQIAPDVAEKQQFNNLVMNIAKGAKVNTSGPHEGNNTPDKAVDGEISGGGWWAAGLRSVEKTHWIFVELDNVYEVAAVHNTFFWDGKRSYQYTVEVSMDGEKWEKVADMTQTKKAETKMGRLVKFKPVKARYVRLANIRKNNNPSSPIHLVEFKVYEKGFLPSQISK